MDQYLLKDFNDAKEFIGTLSQEFDTDSFDVFSDFHDEATISAKITSQTDFGRGSRTSIYVYAKKQNNDLLVTVSDQEWSSIASSLGTTLLSAAINPINLLHRLDDLAVDVQNIQLSDRVKTFVKEFKQHKSDLAIEEIDRYSCKYCKSKNEPKSTHCRACGAPL